MRGFCLLCYFLLMNFMNNKMRYSVQLPFSTRVSPLVARGSLRIEQFQTISCEAIEDNDLLAICKGGSLPTDH